jgi:hypothetical protein
MLVATSSTHDKGPHPSKRQQCIIVCTTVAASSALATPCLSWLHHDQQHEWHKVAALSTAKSNSLQQDLEARVPHTGPADIEAALHLQQL